MKENEKTAALVIPETPSPKNNTGTEKLNTENAVNAAAAAGVVSGTKNLSADSVAAANVPVPVSSTLPDSTAGNKKTSSKERKKICLVIWINGQSGRFRNKSAFRKPGLYYLWTIQFPLEVAVRSPLRCSTSQSDCRIFI